MKKTNYKSDWILVVVGSAFAAIAFAWFADPAKFAPGGVSGIAILVKEITAQWGFPVPLAVTTIVINIPLFLISWKQRGFHFMIKSLVCIISMSLFLALFEYLYPLLPESIHQLKDDLLMSSLFGGAFCGLGCGLVLRANATTGGTDMLASIIKKNHPHFKMAALIFLEDAVIIGASVFVFGLKEAMYAVVMVLVKSVVMNYIVEGWEPAKGVFIISDKEEEIGAEVMRQLERGVTKLEATGGYSKQPKGMLYVVVSKKQMTPLIRLVKSIDEHSFVTVTDMREVLGEGFQEHNDDSFSTL